MKKIMITMLSLATAFSGVPAFAGPISAPKAAITSSAETSGEALVQNIGCNNLTNCPQLNRSWGNRGGWERHGRWEGDRRYHRGWDRDRRYYRDGYYHRRHNNAGAVIGGLAAGAIIGGALASQSNARSYGSHEDYCRAKYRSYRAYDNTYQPNNGPRRQCR